MSFFFQNGRTVILDSCTTECRVSFKICIGTKKRYKDYGGCFTYPSVSISFLWGQCWTFKSDVQYALHTVTCCCRCMYCMGGGGGCVPDFETLAKRVSRSTFELFPSLAGLVGPVHDNTFPNGRNFPPPPTPTVT